MLKICTAGDRTFIGVVTNFCAKVQSTYLSISLIRFLRLFGGTSLSQLKLSTPFFSLSFVRRVMSSLPLLIGFIIEHSLLGHKVEDAIVPSVVRSEILAHSPNV